ncbi:MAG TPA: acetolactate synthase [Myxococcales bacterium]|nr:acetolactate synthase [Myxococcales bacterium]
MSDKHGGFVIGERLAAHGVRYLFTLCGGHISPILTGAEDNEIKVVDVRDEANAAFAADAVARMTGTVGVVAVTAGPGVTNTITAVKNAQMAESPMLIFGGATATILRGRGSLQDIDQLSIMEPITKWSARITQLSALGPAVDKAIRIAQEGVPGPVFLEVPVDLLYPQEVVHDWFMKESGVENGKGLGPKALGMYLKGHLYWQFKAPNIAGIAEDVTPSMPSFVSDSVLKSQRKQVAKKLQAAKKPVLVLGSQTLVNMSPEEADQLAQAVTKMGLPTFLGGMGRGLLGHQSEIQFRHKRSKALKEADVVLVAGFPFDFRLGYGQKIGRRATLIAVNLDAVALKKNRRPDIAIQTHAGHFLQELAKDVGTLEGLDDWFATLREREQARDEEIIAQGEEQQGELVNPLKFFLKLEEKMADDSVLVVDGGDFVATGSYILKPRRPLSWLDPGAFGTLGVGGGFAVGAALCRPDAEVWLIYGDGSSAYSLAEFDTCVRHGLAPIAVIGTDGSWAQIARDQVDLLGTPLGTVLLRSDYHTVAEGYGAVGLLLTEESKIEETIEQAKSLAAEGKPVVINVHIDRTDFRKGSLSI